MANSRDRRKLRRQLQEAGLGHLLKPPASPSSPTSEQARATRSSVPLPSNEKLGKIERHRRWIWGTIVFFATILGLVEAYPWLSVSRGPLLDPANPFSTMYDISNGGFLPVVALDAECKYWFKLTGPGAGGDFNNVGSVYPNFADILYHSGVATLPCFRSIDLERVSLAPEAQMTAKISYFVWPFTCSSCKRQRTFRFKGVAIKGFPMQWTEIE